MVPEYVCVMVLSPKVLMSVNENELPSIFPSEIATAWGHHHHHHRHDDRAWW